MGSSRARLGLGAVMDCYIRLPVCSALYARNAQYARGPSSLHDTRIRLHDFSPIKHLLIQYSNCPTCGAAMSMQKAYIVVL